MGQTDEKQNCSCFLEAFGSILSEGRKPEKLRTYEDTEFFDQSFQQYLKKKKKTFNFMLQTTNQRQV